jgi:hypothetical protein
VTITNKEIAIEILKIKKPYINDSAIDCYLNILNTLNDREKSVKRVVRNVFIATHERIKKCTIRNANLDIYNEAISELYNIFMAELETIENLDV